MARYDTKAATIGDITVTVSKKKDAGDRIQAFLEWLSGKLVDPGYGVGEGQPDNTLPGGGGRPSHPIAGGCGQRPDNTLPGGGPSGGTKPVDPDEGHPDQGLPAGGGRPSHPISGGGPRPDQGLPGGSGAGTKPVDPDEGEAGQLPSFIGENAKEIAKIILKGTLCDPEAQPKR